MSHKQIYYSDKYDDEEFEYRHVMLPKDIAKLVPKTHLMSESEWRNLGVQQSQGWVHYMIHEPGHIYPGRGYGPCIILHQKVNSWMCSK
ncbi:cyclin-dependent kinases regulatory subunit 1 isoform X1 [Mirounga angustirostris]|uniref:cyclin-dependent kinases regulatory subunit 1 isoform X1 n=1 Tax=Mirounga leonina TaxID=9715 RepID=UPI00156C2CBF|nr:cyclin-dependent kinases regulatory subunit 1 isoform X1 [Mirounga leonina]XP_045732474.1 cyclin-dependent kinases regulatory subunit 1 isoform X3 [Mirounga angustirostris]